MSETKKMQPDYLFEVSWEVCNKVGGIHTVIATKAPYLSGIKEGNHIYIGPDVWRETALNPEFSEDPNLFRSWKVKAAEEGIRVRTGRWNIPGNPVAILADFSPYLIRKDEILTNFWKKFGLDSLTGHWDYIESALFGYAAGRAIESFVRYNLSPSQKIAAHFHEWMTGAGLLHIKESKLPVATIFTTHATTVGRSIAGNNLPLYDSTKWSDPDKTANDLNVTAKHSLEKTTVREADVFTTVSDLTAKECKHFLSRDPDVVTPNGFDPQIAPEGEELKSLRKESRALLTKVAEAMTGRVIDQKAMFLGTSGRYEFRNKGLDLFLDSLAILRDSNPQREVIAFIFVPAGHNGPNKELLAKLESGGDYKTNITHILSEPEWDPIVNKVRELKLFNRPEDNVTVLFVPSYLNGNDGVFNRKYYNLLSGLDLTLFPSYYEPWGYTPLESLAYSVPTITTNLAGFGLWIKDHMTAGHPGVEIVERGDGNYREASVQMAKLIGEMAADSPQERETRREGAKKASETALWENLIDKYKKAYSMALDNISDNNTGFVHTQDDRDKLSFKVNVANSPNWSSIIINKQLPERIKALDDISKNLWWSWNEEAIELFKMVDPELWRASHGNPIMMLDSVTLTKARELENDAKFLRKLDSVYAQFNEYMSVKPNKDEATISYFSMEYGLDQSLKIYSGGLGILAGDYLKESSDKLVPITGIGLLYRYGYFTQKLSSLGDQVAEYEAQDFTKLPVSQVRDKDGNWLIVSVAMPGRVLKARLWRADVGRTPLYLLDTDFEDNTKEDRTITHHLYGGDLENRLKQEMLLGIGGIRALRMLGIESEVYHCNEGHAAFTGLERLREYINDKNLSYGEALEVVRASSLFTTHTPVPAGHDAFPEDLLRGYMSHYPSRLKISWEMMMSLGKIDPSNHGEKFSMSNLACNMSQEVNGVSWLHGKVSRDILAPLWPGYLPEELHVGHVTNGVHYPTWTSSEWKQIHSEVFGDDFQSHNYDKNCFEGIYSVDDQRIWSLRNKLRTRLINKIKETLSNPASTAHYTPQQIVQIKESLRDDILTIGFARRFATYKRAHLLFTDIARLDKIVNNPKQPVQFIFAGKAHPADKAGQDLIRHIVEISLMPQFIGRIIFVPGYDMTIAKRLVQGVDIWMNTPTRPLEASGTSGEKAVMNGVMHFSVLDGWWVEGYKEGAGWALPMEKTYENQNYQDELDAATIYNMLENEIAPVFYDSDKDSGVPRYWVNIIKNTIAKVAGNFTTNRMITDYVEQYYKPLAKRHARVISDDYAFAREMAFWKRKMRTEWPHIDVKSINKPDNTRLNLSIGNEYHAEVTLSLGSLSTAEVGVEFVLATFDQTQKRMVIAERHEFTPEKAEGGDARYICNMFPEKAGAYSVAVRMFAKHPDLPHRQDFDLVRWL
ncbi:MAG: alpha-glucan family phosphorylase [Bacteroidales bacterium]|jgi:phosphorylase/glycogen(starch) synthase|nr:alpha-glucan family phosphorylase [Bacteroidales bacterium]